MLQNKIYQNFIIEILKSFFVILLGLSLIALTIRAVNFLDLIVVNGYSVGTYFNFSLLNLFSLAPKFIPLSFLLALSIFIVRHLQDSEFIILYTSGVNKNFIVKVFLFVSIIILIIHLILSVFVTPLALNKSRQILSNQNFNSFMPTIRTQKFSDSFKGFTFFVEKKSNNEIQNIFLQDTGKNLKSLSANNSEVKTITIISKTGLIEEKKLFLFGGKIINSKKDNEHEIVSFDQLTIDLGNLDTTVIKQPKIQETSTISLLYCLMNKLNDFKFCNEGFKKEILPTLNRRIITPFYIPLISLVCSFLLIKRNKNTFQKINVFLFNLVILIFTEIAVRYTGLNSLLMIIYILLPIILSLIIYFFLIFNFSKESKST